MKAENFTLAAYLERIGFRGEASADFETLKRLMRCQLYTVPFENLDVQSGKVVSLVPDEIYRKIVERGRGGYCYEVNGIFSMALETLGIRYRYIAARPMTYPCRRPRTHMALVVEVDDAEWLCDLGFGSYGIREPMNIALVDHEIRQGYDTFRITMGTEGDCLLQSFIEGAWKDLYEFNLHPQEWIDFEPANYMNSVHPDSVFRQGAMVVLQTAGGKHVLLGNRFKTVFEGRAEGWTVKAEELPALLMEKFFLQYPS